MSEDIQTGPVTVHNGIIRKITSSFRVLPDFLIIGGQKCGTTALYNYIIEHPDIYPAVRKQMHYFDNRYEKGDHWYRSGFPTALEKFYIRRILRNRFTTGEATPNYIFHPHAPGRIARLLPHAKFILLLRDPVDRAYSHYNHEIRKGAETLSFAEAIAKEQERLQPEIDRMRKEENYYSHNYQHFSYLTRGIYIDQLRNWLKFFPRQRFLILKAEDLDSHTAATLNRIYEFLDLPQVAKEEKEYERFNRGSYSKIDPEMREKLKKFFRPYNQQLFDLLDINFGWDDEIAPSAIKDNLVVLTAASS